MKASSGHVVTMNSTEGIYCLATVIWEFFTMKYPSCLTLLLLNTTCPVLANSVDSDQLASLDLHCLSLKM